MPPDNCPLCKAPLVEFGGSPYGQSHCDSCGTLVLGGTGGGWNFVVPLYAALASQSDWDHLSKHAAGTPWTGLDERCGTLPAPEAT